MSFEAQRWVLESAPGVPPHLVMTLMGLAWHADDHGRHAYPTQNTLAGYVRKTERAIRKELRDLVDKGLIRPGDPRVVAHLPADRRPNVWDLAVERTVTGGATVPVAGGTGVPVAGGTTVPPGTTVPGGTTVPPATQNQPPEPPETGTTQGETSGTTVPGGTGVPGGTTVPINQPLFEEELPTTELPTNTRPARKSKKTNVTPISDEAFDRFWTAYPRKIAKPAARKAWSAAVKRGADPERVIAAAERHRDYHSRRRTDIQYVPYPASWLNNERYDDAAEPADQTKSAVNGGHQPFRNPTDMSAYYGSL